MIRKLVLTVAALASVAAPLAVTVAADAAPKPAATKTTAAPTNSNGYVPTCFFVRARWVCSG